ncbi:unnamed protein product [Aphis gossypii]|uniref:Uncharacterized protein n=1 Tax=Aphis gossypii TaxID=80765 RepID=A0A9P0J9Y6_APHGO|nr:unnamed protein product [Aphis gossypii]
MQSSSTNETRVAVWKRCRVIGVINMVLVILALVITVVGLVELVTHPNEFNDNFPKDGHKLPNMYITYALMGLTIFIFFGLIYFNYGLLRGSTPNDGNVIKKWLLVHKILLGFFLIILIVQIIIDTKHIMEIGIDVGTIIILLIEIVVVHKFYKELTTSGLENQAATV